MNNIEILFEDNHILIVNKKASDIVQGDKTGDEPLSEKVKQYLKQKYQKPGEVFIGVTHRIDRPVSGVCIFAKTSKALSRLNDMFREHSIHKIYHAMVKINDIPKEGTLEHYLLKNEKQNKSYITQDVKKGKKAKLQYRVIKQLDRYMCLEVILFTGRHHQIRCQLSSIGCPIKGDVKYGYDRPNTDKSIHLHAYSVEFIHPVSKEKLCIQAPYPNDILWQALST